METLRAKLENRGIRTLVDAHAANIGTARTQANTLTILTSSRAITAYDGEHPERILFIAVKPMKQLMKPMMHPLTQREQLVPYISIFAVVKDRDIDSEQMIARWWEKDAPAARNISCVVCLATRWNMQHSSCDICGACMCVRCFRKVYHGSTSMQCTVCRSWKLHGHGYGNPWRLAADRGRDPVEPVGDTPVAKFMSVMSHLDGKIDIIPRVDRSFRLHDSMSMCKLAFTDRYAPNSSRARHISRKLQTLCNKYDGGNRHELLFYVLRNTYKIDKAENKPVTEVSVFQIRGGELRPYGNDMYVDVFGDDKSMHVVKTEIAVPYKPRVPSCVSEMLSTIVAEFPHEKTISISVFRENKEWKKGSEASSFNFDMDCEGNIVTMKNDMLAICAQNMTERLDGERMLVTCRIHRYGNAPHSDFAAYVVIGSSHERLDAKAAKDVFHSNQDELKQTTMIRTFL